MKHQHDVEEYLATQDQILGSLIDKYGKCPFLDDDNDDPDLFDRLASSIIGQQLSTKAASSIRATLLEQARGTTFSPAFFLSATVHDLRSYGLSAAKARTLQDVSIRVQSNPDFLKGMDQKGPEDVAALLCEIKGIGPWTAKMFQIFALRRLDVFAPEDAGLMRGIRITYLNEHDLEHPSIEAITRRWAPYRSIGAWYMWQVANAQPRIRIAPVN
jgi:DNA-3-methyladenine glycosylase II